MKDMGMIMLAVANLVTWMSLFLGPPAWAMWKSNDLPATSVAVMVAWSVCMLGAAYADGGKARADYYARRGR